MTLTSDILHLTSDIIHLLSFTAEGEASDPIRNSLYERECSMWGAPRAFTAGTSFKMIKTNTNLTNLTNLFFLQELEKVQLGGPKGKAN